jgi:putative transposase
MTALAHSIALDPTPEQEKHLRSACAKARHIFNWGLALRNETYARIEWGLSFKDLSKIYTWSLHNWPWHSEYPRAIADHALKDVDIGWKNFFRELKKGSKRAGKPRFKRYGQHDAFYVHNNTLKILEGNRFAPLGSRHPCGYIKGFESLRFDGKVMGARVVRRADRWFLSIQVDVGDDYARERTDRGAVGIDLGIKTAVMLSTGESFDSPKPLRNAQRALTKAQRRLKNKSRHICSVCGKAWSAKAISPSKGSSPSAKGVRRTCPDCGGKLVRRASKNYEKQKMKVARLHRRVADIRSDFLNKVTTEVCRRFDIIVIEDLNVSGMMSNHKLARAISDIGFHEFRRQLEYKSPLYGGQVFVADKWYPSSKTCSQCGCVREKLNLSERTYVCTECGFEVDRDLNAAINLKNLAAGLAVTARGGDGSATSSDKQPAPMKREPRATERAASMA